MQSNTSNGFSIWAKIGLPHTYFRENYPDLDEDSQLLKIKLATLWDNLSKRERKYWRQQARLVSNHWIRDNEMSFAIESFLKKESKIVKQNINYLQKSIPFKLNQA